MQMKYRKVIVGRIGSKNIFGAVRQRMQDNVKAGFKSPEAELLLGMVLGMNDMYRLPRTRKMFVDTGTIHVVVVSGFNISLVYNLIFGLSRSSYKSRSVTLANIFVLLYVCLVGFQPPVVRAWLMGLLNSISKYYGKNVPILWLLLLSGLLMLVYNPFYLFSLSFQLSFLATTGLIVFSEPIRRLLVSSLNMKSTAIREDFISTVSAQVLVWPLLSYRFGTVSLSSFFVNALVLWTVPLVTVLGFFYIAISFISSFLAYLMRLFLMLPLSFFVYVVRCFSNLRFGVMHYQVSTTFVSAYYLLAFFALIYSAKISDQNR